MPPRRPVSKHGCQSHEVRYHDYQDHQGYSDALNLHIRWHNGCLEWCGPETGRHGATLDDERATRIEAETRAAMAEARNREIEKELRRLRGK